MMNIKENLNLFLKNFKKETTIIDIYLTPSKKWEQLISIFFFIIYFTYEVMRIQDLDPSLWIRIGVGLGFFGWTCALINQVRRDFKGLKMYWKIHLIPEIKQLWFNPTIKNKMPLITSTLLANSWKAGKPILKACALCIGAGSTFNYGFSEYYGFSPLQELRAYNLGLQTKEQMINHIFVNPNDYVGNPDKPYIQDIKKAHAIEMLKKDEQIQKLMEEIQNRRRR